MLMLIYFNGTCSEKRFRLLRTALAALKRKAYGFVVNECHYCYALNDLNLKKCPSCETELRKYV